MNDANLPITGICIIAKPSNVPTGYQCIRKAHDDTNRDADLMADSLLGRRDRFLCITRSWPLNDIRTVGNDRALILEDIRFINERDNPPANYTSLAHTTDTREKGTDKKLICVKMVERQPGMKCICDIIFLYRSRRPPPFYTLMGDINGLQMCVKEGTVPPFTNQSSQLYPNPVTGQRYSLNPQQQQQHYHEQLQRQPSDYTSTLTKKADEKEILDGIPFEINPKYLKDMKNTRNGNNLTNFESFRILTPYEVEQYFNYDFHTERSSLQ